MKPARAPTNGFRHDVNALRALAVVSVILYHFDIPGFDGGFAGVDIFFVISGFLMTRILASYENLEALPALGRFYLQRARRIIPALLVLLLALLGAGWFLLPPSDYSQLASQIITSICFVSNVQFWKTSGYFDGAAHENWLLHTWSLSVEWQFYMLLPVLYIVLFRVSGGRRGVAIGCAATMAVSLLACLFGTQIRPVAAFYLLPTRAWEMLAGGLVFFWAENFEWTPRRRAALSCMGLGAILFSVALFDAWDTWPGWRAILPVAGTAAVLAAHPRTALAENWLLGRLGAYSYSLYLWHWPVLVFLTMQDQHMPAYKVIAGLSLSLALGALSFHLVEQPSQGLFSREPRTALKLLGSAALASVVGSAVIIGLNGAPQRVDQAVTQLSQLAMERPLRNACLLQEGLRTPSCLYGGPKIKAVVIGDSHANGAMPAIEAAARSRHDLGVMEWTYAGCPTIQGVRYRSPGYEGSRCGEFVKSVLEKTDALPPDVAVIYMARTSAYAKGHNEGGRRLDERPLIFFEDREPEPEEFAKEFTRRFIETACRISGRHKLYLVLPTPEMTVNVPKTMARVLMSGSPADYAVSKTDYRKRNDLVIAAEQAAAAQCGATLLDPTDYLCPEETCPASMGGTVIYRDSNHLNREGNKLLVPMFLPVFD